MNQAPIMVKNGKALLVAAALLGLSVVVLDAYISHSQSLGMTSQQISELKTAIHYQQYHAVLLTAVSLFVIARPAQVNGWLLLIVGWLWVMGILLFCGTIYSSILLPWSMTVLTPVGGTLLIAAWLLLLGVSFKL